MATNLVDNLESTVIEGKSGIVGRSNESPSKLTDALNLDSVTDKVDLGDIADPEGAVTHLTSGFGSLDFDSFDTSSLTDELDVGGLATKLDLTKLTSGVSKRGDLDLSGAEDELDLSSLDIRTLTDKLNVEDFTDKLDFSQLASGLSKRQDKDIVNDVPAGDISRRLLGLSDILSTVTSLTYDIESTLGDLVAGLEDADIEGILTNVEGLADVLLEKV